MSKAQRNFRPWPSNQERLELADSRAKSFSVSSARSLHRSGLRLSCRDSAGAMKCSAETIAFHRLGQ